MNTTLIEELGINSLERLILKTRVIHSKLNKIDKYPIWDGELLVYNSCNFSAKNLVTRVPVQIKSELLSIEKKEIEKYSVKISHLEKYANEGGVLFIKNIEDTDNDRTYFYARLLLKADIIELLEKTKENQETKTIDLFEVTTGSEILTMCYNYNLHKPLQMQLPSKNNIKKLIKNNEIYTYGYVNNIKELVINEQYGYARIEGDILGYIGKIKTSALYGKNNVPIYTENKKYYDFVIEVVKEDEQYYQINENAIIKDGQLILYSSPKKEVTLSRAISNLEFVKDLYKNKKIKIGKSKLTTLKYEDVLEEELITNINNVEKNLDYLYNAKKTFDLLNIPIDKVTVEEVINIENEICRIRDIIVKGEKINFDSEISEHFIYQNELKNVNVLIYFIKQIDGKYIGYDYLTSNVVFENLRCNIDGEDIQLSRFYNLKADTIIKLNLNAKKIINELKLCTINDVTIDMICYMMMEFIKAYDLSGEKNYLLIATSINNFLRKQRDYYSEQFYKINKYQIMKRKDNVLEKKEIDKILLMKIKSNNLIEKCACCLLLEQYDEFIIAFSKLKKEEKNLFKKWSIFNLLPSNYNSKIDL